MNLILVGALSLALACCGGREATDTTMVISSDPELRALVASLLPDLAARSGLQLREPIRVERRSRGELEGYLRGKLDEELSEEEEGYLTRAYALLGLVPEDLDLRGLLLSVYTEQIAGFYDPDSTALFVLDDQPTETLTTLLVHELVHAVQDQAADLNAITDKDRGNDHQTAAQAAIEGHATVVMLEYMMEQLQDSPVDLSEIPDFAAQLRPELDAVRGQYPALASAPRVIQEAMLFPYLEGAAFVQALWQAEDGRPAPFGPYLPKSTEQIIDPSKLGFAGRDDPTPVGLRVPGRSIVLEDELGQLETGIFLEELAGTEAGDAAVGWDGDRFALLDGGGGLVWVTVWDDFVARDRFVTRVGGRIQDLPAEAVVEGVEVSGRPVAILRLGDTGEVVIELGGG